jgi:hypothetical protein
VDQIPPSARSLLLPLSPSASPRLGVRYLCGGFGKTRPTFSRLLRFSRLNLYSSKVFVKFRVFRGSYPPPRPPRLGVRYLCGGFGKTRPTFLRLSRFSRLNLSGSKVFVNFRVVRGSYPPPRPPHLCVVKSLRIHGSLGLSRRRIRSRESIALPDADPDSA